MQNAFGNKPISSLQLLFSAAVFIIATNLLTYLLYPYTENQTWLAVLIATAAGLLLVSIYGRLASKHGGRSLFDISEAVFGPVLGKLVTALYVFFFLTLTVFNTRDFGNFVKQFVLQTTPADMIYVFFLIVCSYAVKKGADKIMRFGALIFFIYLALLIFITLLLVTKIKLENFLPAFTVSLKNQLLSADIILMMPFGESLAFLSAAHLLSTPAAAGRSLRRGLLVGAAVLMLLVTRDIAVLGNYTVYTSNPTFNTIRLIDVGDVLTRLEIINAVVQMTLLFFKTAILMYATVTGFTRLFNTSDYKPFTLIFGALILVCSGFFFQSSFEQRNWYGSAAAYATFFLIILPAATLIVSEIRTRGRNENGDAPSSSPDIQA